ncbi:MAG TPA: hypothetical protein VE133_16710 [Candidatus Sulfotelmatobacter sp.]|nr:hypothetical protein [Candidatus Sulfotelmatobacter sp.]
MTTNDEVLNSWKEVASYMGRGVRTVQRWEQELGLPVRRPRGKSRSAVIAFKSELDRWLHNAPGDQVKEQDGEAPAPDHRAPAHDAAQRQAQLNSNTHTLVVKTQMLVSRSYSLCNKLKNLQERLERNLRLTSSRAVERKERDLGPVAVPSNEDSKPATEQLRKDHAIAS